MHDCRGRSLCCPHFTCLGARGLCFCARGESCLKVKDDVARQNNVCCLRLPLCVKRRRQPAATSLATGPISYSTPRKQFSSINCGRSPPGQTVVRSTIADQIADCNSVVNSSAEGLRGLDLIVAWRKSSSTRAGICSALIPIFPRLAGIPDYTPKSNPL
jgi:hypothetical protein